MFQSTYKLGSLSILHHALHDGGPLGDTEGAAGGVDGGPKNGRRHWAPAVLDGRILVCDDSGSASISSRALSTALALSGGGDPSFDASKAKKGPFIVLNYVHRFSHSRRGMHASPSSMSRGSEALPDSTMRRNEVKVDVREFDAVAWVPTFAVLAELWCIVVDMTRLKASARAQSVSSLRGRSLKGDGVEKGGSSASEGRGAGRARHASAQRGHRGGDGDFDGGAGLFSGALTKPAQISEKLSEAVQTYPSTFIPKIDCHVRTFRCLFPTDSGPSDVLEEAGGGRSGDSLIMVQVGGMDTQPEEDDIQHFVPADGRGAHKSSRDGPSTRTEATDPASRRSPRWFIGAEEGGGRSGDSPDQLLRSSASTRAARVSMRACVRDVEVWTATWGQLSGLTERQVSFACCRRGGRAGVFA